MTVKRAQLAAVCERLRKDKIALVQMWFTGMDGRTKSKDIPVSKFEDAVRDGVCFDGSSIEGMARIQESDMFLKPDLTTYARVPWLDDPQGNTARFFCDIFTPNQEPFTGDPRYILRRAIDDAHAMGFEYFAAPELEFMLIKENGSGPLPHDGAGYLDMNTDLAMRIRRDIMLMLRNCFGIDDESGHHEVADGQHEIAFKYDHAMSAANNTITVKEVIKAVARMHGVHATFMAKPRHGENGSGMHIHQSLFKNGKNAFYAEDDAYHLSKTARQFIAGQLVHVQAMTAILNPTVNSYKRLVPGFEAPVYLAWARHNRSALIRVPATPEGKISSARIELRSPDPTANIYLAFAVMLESGLDGIRQKMTPPRPFEENIYHLEDADRALHGIGTLPETLKDALHALQKDSLLKRTLGEPLFTRYVAAKQKEWMGLRTEVTPGEIALYMNL